MYVRRSKSHAWEKFLLFVDFVLGHEVSEIILTILRTVELITTRLSNKIARHGPAWQPGSRSKPGHHIQKSGRD